MTPSPPAGFAPLASLSPQAGEGSEKVPLPTGDEGLRVLGKGGGNTYRLGSDGAAAQPSSLLLFYEGYTI